VINTTLNGHPIAAIEYLTASIAEIKFDFYLAKTRAQSCCIERNDIRQLANISMLIKFVGYSNQKFLSAFEGMIILTINLMISLLKQPDGNLCRTNRVENF